MLALAAIGLASPAAAQLSGSVTVASDYRLRGVSLTDQRPAVTLEAVYDHPSGAYAGASVVAADPANHGPRVLGHQEYVGFARRTAEGFVWDVGVSNVDLSLYLDRRYAVAYTQGYVGLSRGGLSGRLSLAPDYPRRGVATAYAELNGVARPAERWRVSGHLGAVVRLGGSEYLDGRRDRYDLTLAVAREFQRGEVSLSWTGVVNRPRDRPPRSASRPGVAVAASVLF